jgi:hypothetical protein
MKWKRWLLIGLAVMLLFAVAACEAEDDMDMDEENGAAEEGAGIDAVSAMWWESGHADFTSESFVHWDEDEPPIIPDYCAKCHSTYGYLDFLGTDGSAAGSVDEASPVGSTVTCIACHNEEAMAMSSVTFPSGEEVTDLGNEAICFQCHSGRSSTVQVREAIAGADEDAVLEEQGFINVHYHVAALTLMGDVVQGGYQYEGRDYEGRFGHVDDYDSCIECHDPHNLEVNAEACAECHEGAEEDLMSIREAGEDFDADGDVDEGIAGEIETYNEILYDAIQTYATEVVGNPIVYELQFPYWFIDTDGDGEVDEGEAAFPNQYNAWTPRLLKAAYNYHLVLHDPGAYTHNPEYIMQLQHDSIMNLAEAVEIDVPDLDRP